MNNIFIVVLPQLFSYEKKCVRNFLMVIINIFITFFYTQFRKKFAHLNFFNLCTLDRNHYTNILMVFLKFILRRKYEHFENKLSV